MGETAEALVARLSADLSQFTREVQRGAQIAEEFGRDASRGFDRIARSADNIDRELEVLNAQFRAFANVGQDALGEIAQSSRQTAREMQALRNQLAETTRRANQAGNAAQQLNRRTLALGSSFSQLAVILGTLGLANFARNSADLATQLISVERTLTATTGSASAAGEAYGFVRTQAIRLGTDIVSGARAFAQMTENTRGTALAGQGVRTIFSALGETVAGLGLDQDQYRRALIATNQTLARSRIATEELNQFAEAGIPIFRILADTLRISGDDLRKALEQGLVPSEALLLVAEQLRDRFGEVARQASETTPVAFRALSTVTQETSAQLFTAGFASTELNRAIRRMTDIVDDFGKAFDRASITLFVDEIVRLGEATLRFGLSVETFFENLRRGAESLTGFSVRPALEQFQEGFVSFFQRLTGAREETVRAYAQLIFGLEEAGTTATESLTNQLGALRTVLDAAAGFDRNLRDSIDAFENIPVGFVGFGKTIQDALKDTDTAINDTSNRAAEAGRKIREALAGIGEGRAVETAAKAIADIRLRVLEAGLEDERRAVLASLNTRSRDELQSFIDTQRQLLRLQRRLLTETVDDRTLEEIRAEQALIDSRLQLIEAAEAEITDRRLDEVKRRVERELEEEKRLIAEDKQLNKDLADIEADALIQTQRDIQKINKQRAQDAKDAAEEAARPFVQAFKNIQDAQAEAFDNLLAGQLDSFNDFGDEIINIARRTAAELIAAFATADLTNALKRGLGLPGATAAPTGPGLFGIEGLTAGRAIGGGILGIGAGFGASNILGGLGVGGGAGGFLSGAVGGAAAGGLIGGLPGGLIGGAVGGLGGFISSIFGGGGPDTQRIALNTSQQVVEAAQKTALGFVQLLGEGSERVDAGQITNTIAELDRTIALSLSERQKQLASAALANPVNATVLGAGSEGTDDALAQVVAQRLKIIVAGIGGSAVAENVVGDVAGLESSELQAVQQRVADAIAILRQIEEIETGPRTETGRRIAAIEQEFADAIARAEEFGIATTSLEAERQRQILEIQQDAQRSVDIRTLAITDPDEAARQELAERQRRERDELLAAGVSVADIDRLFLLEREQLARDLEAANVNVEAANDGIRRNAELLLLSLTDPFAEAQARIADQIDELRQQLDEGIISPDLFNQLEAQIQLAGQANEALRIIGGGPSGPVDQVARAFGGFLAAGNPLSASGQALFNLTEQFKLLAEATEFLGGSTEALEESYLAQAQVIRNELIAEIDRELDARRREIESIDDLIASFRVDASLPGNLRLGAAESQFQQALAGGNIQDIIAAANQLREIAQAQFGFSEGFFDIQREIEAGLSGARDSAQAAIEQERSDRIAAADREQQMILNGTQQIDIMNTLVNSFDRSGLFLEELVALQTEQRTENARIRGILEELLARQRN